MIIVDTSVWIEFFRNKNISIVERLTEFLENGSAIGLSPVFGELWQGAGNEEGAIISEFWESIPKINEENLFIEAGKLSNRLKPFSKGVSLIDCYLLAAAKKYNLNLWTLDKKLQEAFLKS